jgi:multidrug efflux system membrane fusion protein
LTTGTSSIQSPAPPRRRSIVARVVIWAAVLLVFALGFYLVLTHKEVAKASGRRGFSGPVTTVPATAKKGDIGVYLPAIGTVTPVFTSSITSQVNGVVTAVHYVEGQIVKIGDPLIDIDARPYEATLLQAQGLLERDQGVLAQARMDFERYLTAWSRNAIAKQLLDDQEKIVLQDQGTVKNDEGTVEFDKLQVEYCHITAPIAGRVGLRLVDPGNVVQSSASSASPLVVITQEEPITVIFTLSEDQLEPVLARLRKKVKLPVDAYDRTFETNLASGELLALDNQIDTTTGTVKMRAIFNNENEALFPNQFVNTLLLRETLEGVTLIPSSAIQQSAQTFFVYVLEDNVAHMREVKPGVTNNGLTQVEGINPGDIVADSSFDKLQDGVKVTIAGADGAAAKGTHTGGKHGGKHPEGTGGAGGTGGSSAP